MRKITFEVICKFKKYLINEEKSEATVEKYIRDVKTFYAYIGKQNVEKNIVIDYKHYLQKRYMPVSVNSMLSSLNALFIYLGWYDLKVKTLKIQRQIFSVKEKELTKGEYERLLLTAKAHKNQRLFYLMQTMGSTGIRISELKFVTCEAVRNGYAVINCKGKLRQVFFPNQLCKMLKRYINEEKIKSGPIFISKNGNPLNRSNIWKMLKNLCEEANVPKEKVFPHNFRHLFARTYYSIQKDIVRLADILGHSSINTTRIYTIETGETHCKQLQKLGLLIC